MANDSRRVSKADFVWTMLRLANADRDAYRALRERGWLEFAANRVLQNKSDIPN